MEAFSYLSVLLSVILGLAIQQVLTGYRVLLLGRARVRWYALPLIWSVLILLMVAQHWWSSFGLAGRSDWSFAMFATILTQTALIYMMAALVLPDVPAGTTTDLRQHYERESRPFFLVAAAAIVWSGLREVVLNGELPQGGNLVFHLLFLTMTLITAFTRRARVHEVFAGLMVVLFGVYVWVLFARLG